MVFLKCHIRFNLNLNYKDLLYLVEASLNFELDLTYYPNQNLVFIAIGVYEDYKILLLKLLYLYPSNFIMYDYL